MTTERRIGRREALKRVGVLAASPVLAGTHPLVPAQPGGGPWRPVFFDAGEVELVAALAEDIVPETDTPGARAARVHQYIDLVLSEATRERAAAFRRGLEPFVGVSPARRLELLESGMDGDFFRELKQLTIEGYYGSEVGMKQELGFEGRSFVTEFEGCQHDEHLSWSPREPPKDEDER